ncbi:hypothetical protein ACOSQ2_011264 [Xanthoceras sorbifolium]
MDFEDISRQCEKLSLTEEDDPVARIDDDLQALGRSKLSLSLLGKIIGYKDVNRDAFRATIASIWRTTKEVEVESIGVNMFVFRFKCQWDQKRVLEGGPWSFDKQLLVLQEVEVSTRVSDLQFRFVPF